MTSPIPAHEGQRPAQLRLRDEDFDARRPDEAPSESTRRARLELRQRMVSWASRVVSRLSGLDVALEVAGTDERTAGGVSAQRVAFGRDAVSRELFTRWAVRHGVPYDDGGASMALAVDPLSVAVSMELRTGGSVDGRNLEARLADAEASIELTSALEALPEQFLAGLAGTPCELQAQRTRREELTKLLSRIDTQAGSLWIGWSVPREVAVAHSALLDEQLEDAIVALASIYKLVAWAPDNDMLRWSVSDNASKVSSAEASPTASGGGRRPADREDAAWDRRGSQRRGRDRGSHAHDESSRRGKPLGTRATQRSGGTTGHSQVRLGMRVRVLAGPFVGKEGIVQELDGKGGARVMLGLLATRVAVRDLAASSVGRERPALRSSHRKLPLRGT